jgi:glyoxylase-like metal-dependent hydrolase (beta-lactamase superfamily II)
MDFRVISIGTLAANDLWNERGGVRTGHATTTLIMSGKHRILVDPGLPEQVLIARLQERVNVRASEITHVFLTSFLPDTRRGILAFDRAVWWISAQEREVVGAAIAAKLKEMVEDDDPDTPVRKVLEQDIAILKRCQPAPDHLADRVDLFPLHGVTPGCTGLILSGERFTTVITGDAIATQEHLEQGKILPSAHDLDQARASFEDAVEVADMLIPGRDNLVVNPTKRPF